MNGSVKPTVWNRDKVLETIVGVNLEGSLPAGRVTAARRGRTLAGRVTDCNGHPAAGETVHLERQSGARWTRVAAGNTTAAGAYSLRAPGSGAYRVVAGAKRSAPVRVP